MRTTVEHVVQRRQFGQLLGGFQALKHRLAQAWIDVDSARFVADRAAVEGDPDLDLLVAVAQSMCSEVALQVAEECIQMHGGTGMTWEHPAHVYLKRALADVSALGSPEHHHASIAQLVHLPGSVHPLRRVESAVIRTTPRLRRWKRPPPRFRQPRQRALP
ncbi:hypothetical protein C6I20_13730 [Aeromicrobium sp. A1-2]|nr:hypothetical protein C6I20_13730 [Aeromicrobium sp. A1-2]